MLDWTLLLTLTLASAGGATECVNPPTRTSDLYWGYIDACGCSKLDPPSAASQDYSRYLKACSSWRERNQGTVVPPAPADPARPGRECDSAPSRVSEAYWEFLDACGCSKVDPPSSSSSDYPRYLKACGQWREKNPAASPTPTPKPTPKPAPGKKP